VRDDFSDPRSGFPTLDDETQRVAYEDGSLRLDLRLAGRATWSARRIGDWPLADVTARFTLPTDPGTGFYGLTCGLDAQHFYAGVVGTDGTALLLRVDEGVATRLAQVFSAYMPPGTGGSVALGLDCVGSDAGTAPRVSLAISGRDVASATDPDGFAGSRTAGLYAESMTTSPTFSVRADDFVTTVGLRAGPTVSPSSSPSLTGDPLADALAEHVPEALRATCRKVDRPEFEDSVAVDCPSTQVTSAVYLQYATTELMAADFAELLAAHPEATGSDCAAAPGNGPYTVDGTEVGRLLCYSESGSVWYAWTDDRVRIMGVARRSDGSFPFMYQWWLQAGPTL
jgi:hypothetical protein